MRQKALQAITGPLKLLIAIKGPYNMKIKHNLNDILAMALKDLIATIEENEFHVDRYKIIKILDEAAVQIDMDKGRKYE